METRPVWTDNREQQAQAQGQTVPIRPVQAPPPAGWTPAPVPVPANRPYPGAQYPAPRIPAPPATNRPQQQAPQDAPGGNVLPIWILVIAITAGAFLALLTIPVWVPVLGASVVGTDPKVWWYLSRAAGLVSFVLLWVSTASGIIISNKMARIWPGNFTAFDLHQYTSLLALGFITFHVVVLLGNTYIPYNLATLFIPFAGTDYRPLWVGLGQIGLYLSILVTFTFYIRKQIGNRTWHAIHFLSYGMFAIALIHGVMSGTDTGNVWVNWMYWLGGASIVALTMYRVAVSQSAQANNAS